MNHINIRSLLIMPVLVLVSNYLIAQQSPVTCGGEVSGTNGSVSFTVGQVLNSTITSAEGIVIQGVQQPGDVVQLPITLLHFSARVINEAQVSITWSTTAEWNNSYFSVEKSKNGIGFTAFNRVNSKGNSNTIQQYQALDSTPYAGKSYYRLTQHDISGKSTVSHIVPIEINNISAQIMAYPNPTTSFLTLYLQYVATPNLSYTIYNAEGKAVSQQRITSNTTNISTASLASGTYWLKIIDQNQTIKTFTITKN